MELMIPPNVPAPGGSGHQITFWIFDFRFWIESQENKPNERPFFEVSFRQSKIGNPKSSWEQEGAG